MKQIHLYLLILGIVVIGVSLWLCYNTEGFQTAPPRLSQPAPATTIANFWDISNRLDRNDDFTTRALTRVSDPDPNDENDTMPLSFSKYISIYALARFNGDLSGARLALFNDYNTLQTEMSRDVYDTREKTTWEADPINQSCKKLDLLRGTFIAKYAETVSSVQDLSGTAILAGTMRDENLAYQQLLISKCQGSPLSPACVNLANQEGPVFSLVAKYDNANTTLFSAEIDISNNLQTINDTYAVLGCKNPNQFFKGSSATYWINNNIKYAVANTSCSATINANMSGTSPGPMAISDSVLNRIPTGPTFTCNMVATAQLQFNDSTTGIVDTTVLLSKLQTMSPYYLSPDTLNYITSSVISSADATGSVMTTADILIDIRNVINNIKLLTGTQ
jgi:hypothetical protein